MQPTDRMYYADSYLRRFTATVVAHGALGDRAAVALDRSAFYPEGGGQPADRGDLSGAAVLDVQVDADGVVWHSLAEADSLRQLPIGATIAGAIDWARRHDHMQQHCGQHILSAAFSAACGLTTSAFHLGEAGATIDLAAPDLRDEQARAAEDLANAVVWEDRTVTARFVTPAELAGLPLRKPPSVATNVRVVTVADFDYSACGGTHPRSSGGVGLISVLRWSRQRGSVRVEFACGGRALLALRRLATAAGAAASALSVGVDELPAAATRLLAAQKAQARELEQAQAALDSAEALRLYAAAAAHGPARLVCAALAGASPERLRTIAQAVAAQPGGVALLGTVGERAHLIAACAIDSERDARALLQAGLALVTGRGGGSARLAQGGGPDIGGLAAALEAMRAAAVSG